MSELTVIIPAYNEGRTILQVIERFLSQRLQSSELIVVDDGSTDETTTILRNLDYPNVHIVFKNQNEGKTSAVRAGLALASGRWVLVQDADLEYDPADIKLLLKRAGDGAPVVYGRRPACWGMPSRWLFASGVLLIDIALLFVYRRWVRDHASCYKLVPRTVLVDFELQSTGFEGCIEITAKLMRCHLPVAQVPISYRPRRVDEGKKLTPAYGWTALRSVLRWRNWTSATGTTSAGVAASALPYTSPTTTVTAPSGRWNF